MSDEAVKMILDWLWYHGFVIWCCAWVFAAILSPSNSKIEIPDTITLKIRR